MGLMEDMMCNRKRRDGIMSVSEEEAKMLLEKFQNIPDLKPGDKLQVKKGSMPPYVVFGPDKPDTVFVHQVFERRIHPLRGDGANIIYEDFSIMCVVEEGEKGKEYVEHTLDSRYFERA
jgi:hypothetical protein